MGFKKGVIHIGLIVLVLAGLAVATTVGISARHRIDGRPFSNWRLKPSATPSIQPSINPISWKTPYASLEADDFYIELNGKRFVGSGQVTRLDSSPPYQQVMTLEVEWTENSVPMRAYIYFVSDGNTWKVNRIWTYNGTSQSGWVYYPGFPGAAIGAALSKDVLTLNSTGSDPIYTGPLAGKTISGTIYFKNLKLQAFLKPTGCASEKPAVSFSPSSPKVWETITATITARADCAGKKVSLENHTGDSALLERCILALSSNNSQCTTRFSLGIVTTYGYYFQVGIDLDGNGTFENWSNGVTLYVTGATPSPSPDLNRDSDGDGFKDSLEVYLGTDPNLSCGNNAWPPDFNNDGKITSIDILAINQHIGTSDRRYDLNGDGNVTTADTGIVQNLFNKSC